MMLGTESTVTSGLLGAAGAFAVAAAAWFGHRRERAQHSGTVETSQASELWRASEQFRHDLSDRVTANDDRIEQLEQALREQTTVNQKLSRRVEQLTELLREHGIEFNGHEPGGL